MSGTPQRRRLSTRAKPTERQNKLHTPQNL